MKRTNCIWLALLFTALSADGQTIGGSLDRILSRAKAATAAAPSNSGATKESLFAEIESEYFAQVERRGRLPMAADYRSAGKLSDVLVNEYGAGANCLQERTRSGKTSPSSQARQVYVAMFEILDSLDGASGRSDNSADRLRQRIDSLGKPGMGCPSDFPAIKRFLDEFADFATGMVSRKDAKMAENRAAEAARIKVAKEEDEKRQSQLREAQAERDALEAERKKIADAEQRKREEERLAALRVKPAAPASGKKADQSAEKNAAPMSEEERIYAEANKAPDDYTNVIRPLVEPNKKLYRWCGILERADKDETLSSYLITLGDRRTRFMVFAGKEARTMLAFSGELRIGGQICAAGYYSANAQLGGKTVPVLAATVIYK